MFILPIDCDLFWIGIFNCTSVVLWIPFCLLFLSFLCIWPPNLLLISGQIYFWTFLESVFLLYLLIFKTRPHLENRNANFWDSLLSSFLSFLPISPWKPTREFSITLSFHWPDKVKLFEDCDHSIGPFYLPLVLSFHFFWFAFVLRGTWVHYEGPFMNRSLQSCKDQHSLSSRSGRKNCLPVRKPNTNQYSPKESC